MFLKQRFLLLGAIAFLAVGLGSCDNSNSDIRNAVMHEVRFVDHNGLLISEHDIEHGTTVPAATISAATVTAKGRMEDGFRFVRWNLMDSTVINADTTFAAISEIITHKISYLAANYTDVYHVENVPHRSPVPTIAGPTGVAGEVFLGWQILTNSVVSDLVVYPRMSGTSYLETDDGLFYYVRSDGMVLGGISGVGWPSATNHSLPNEVNGIPVVAIGALAFSFISNDSGYDLYIPEHVLSIGERAFESYDTSSYYNGVIFNDALREIKAYAFQDTEIYWGGYYPLSSSIEHIGEYAFAYANLDGFPMVFLENLTVIPDYCFFASHYLPDFQATSNLERIGKYAFGFMNYGDTFNVDLSYSNVTVIDEGAFSIQWGSWCRDIGYLTLPSNLEYIGAMAFGEALINGTTNSLSFPSSLRYIGYDAFYGCLGLRSVTFNQGLETIDAAAFQACSYLESDVIIPDSVTKLGNNAFQGATEASTSHNVKLVIGAGLKEIERYTFDQCYGFNEIYIHPNVEIIRAGAFRSTDFTGIIDFGTNSKLRIIESAAFEYSAMAAMVDITIVLPAGVTSIGSRAFGSPRPTMDMWSADHDRFVDISGITDASLLAILNTQAGWREVFDPSWSYTGLPDSGWLPLPLLP